MQYATTYIGEVDVEAGDASVDEGDEAAESGQDAEGREDGKVGVPFEEMGEAELVLGGGAHAQRVEDDVLVVVAVAEGLRLEADRGQLGMRVTTYKTAFSSDTEAKIMRSCFQ